MKLRDPRTGEVRDFDDRQLHELVLNQGFELPTFTDPNGVARVRMMAGGDRYAVPVHEIRNFLGDFPDARVRNEADDWVAGEALLPGAENLATAGSLLLGPLAAVPSLAFQAPGAQVAQATGQLSGASLGLSDALLAAADPDLARALQEQYPGAKLGGELQGIAASIAASGGTTLAATAPSRGGGVAQAVKGLAGAPAKVAPKAAPVTAAQRIASLTPTRVVANWSDRVGAKLVGELASKTAKMGPVSTAIAQMGARGATFAGLGATEAALWSISGSLEEKALGDPRELGEILAANAGTSAIIGGLFGGTLGVGGALFSATVGQAGQRIAGKIDDMAQTGELADMARSAAINDLGAQAGLTNSQLRRLHRNRDAVSWVVDDTVLPDGSIIRKRLEDGTTALVDKAEMRRRLGTAVDLAGDDIGRLNAEMAALAEAVPGANLTQLQRATLDVRIIQKELRNLRGQDAILKMRELQQAEAVLDDLLELSGYVSGRRLADLLKESAKRKGVTSAVDTVRNTLRADAQRYRDKGVLSWAEVMEERRVLGKRFQQIEKLPGGDVAQEDASRAFREVWDHIDNLSQERIERFMPDSIEPWARAKDIYRNLVVARGMVNDVLERGGPVNEVQGALQKLASIAQGRMALSGASSVQGAVRGAMMARGLGGAAGMGIGGLAGGIPGALVGAGLGVGLGAGIRRFATPRPFRVTELGMKVAQNQELLKAANQLTRTVDKSVKDWLSRSTTRAVVTPLIGKEVVTKLGGKRDAKKSAATIRRRTARLMQSPSAFGQFLAQTAGPLQAIHPETGLAYADATARQVAAIQLALNRIPRQQGTLQPALSTDFEDATDADMERFGVQLAAVVEPERVVQEIMQGVATQEQIDTFRMAHPALFAMLLRAVARRTSMHKERLTPQQQQTLTMLGLGGSTTLPGFSARSQIPYQMAQAGMPAGGTQPGHNALGDLMQTENPYSTRETRRGREDATG